MSKRINTSAQPPPNEPPAKIIIDSRLAEPLSRGVIFLQYRAENLHIVPVFEPAALAVPQGVGHNHVTVNGASWHWADASGLPVIINGLGPGRQPYASAWGDSAIPNRPQACAWG